MGEAVDAAVAERPPTRGGPILVAHSFGCLASAPGSARSSEAVAAVLLGGAGGSSTSSAWRDLAAGPQAAVSGHARRQPQRSAGCRSSSAIDWAARMGHRTVVDARALAGHINCRFQPR
ncbi:hypothetical protein ACU4GD_39390 [Cupriavidus basilensis]